MNTNIRNLSVLSLAAAVLLATQTQSFAGEFAQKHPRRAEVLHRSNHINNRINADKGNLSGHYSQLKREDRSVVRQEQHDARTDGGHITRGEQKQLNHEENHLNKQIQRDHD